MKKSIWEDKLRFMFRKKGKKLRIIFPNNKNGNLFVYEGVLKSINHRGFHAELLMDNGFILNIWMDSDFHVLEKNEKEHL